MDLLLYCLVRPLVALLQALPLRTVARLGRAGGALAYWIDGRHRKVALANLAACFGQEKSPAEVKALAKENFRRLGENYACAIKTAGMSGEELRPHLEFVGVETLLARMAQSPLRNAVLSIGHFGNFELYAHIGHYLPGIRCATTYRGLNQPSLNRLMQSLREKSGCLYFERRSGAEQLRSAMEQGGLLLGLLVDQHPGRRGVVFPFFGRECYHSAAPAVYALRYQAALFTAICYRVGLARWRIETGPEIPTYQGGQPRSIEAITADIAQAFEAAIRRDPTNWFWVHKRWKPTSKKPSGEIATEQSSQQGC